MNKSPLKQAGVIAGAATQVVGGIAQTIFGNRQRKAANRRLKNARKRMQQRMGQFEQLDTSNPYLNMQNVYEDATIDQRAAEFTRQQQQQSQANIMQGLQGAAGGSGIAGLAQAMANQGSLDAQSAAASIGQQEQANQARAMGEAAKLQGQEVQGEMYSRGLERDKVSTLLGMAQSQTAAERENLALAQQQMYGGIGNIAGALGQGLSNLDNQ